MPFQTFRRRFRAAPWGLVGMIVLVGMVEGVLSRFAVDLRLPIENQWWTQGLESRGQAAHSEILCLGDSLVAEGVIPAILEQRLGQPAYNLGLGGGQFPGHYFLLRRALEAGAKPSALVIDAIPMELKITGRERVPLWATLLDHRELVELAWFARDPALLGELLLAKSLISMRSRHQIRQAIVEGLAGSKLSYREKNRAGTRNQLLNRGVLLLPKYGNSTVDPRHHRWIYPDVVTVDRLNGEAMEKFFELAESHRIPVFWLLTPVNPEIQSRAEQLGTYETNVRFIRQVQARHPGLTVIDARRSGYPESVLGDSIHLSEAGAAVFTADLADAIARTSNGGSTEPKWVKLPRFRDRPITFRHENLAESTKALSTLRK